MLREFLWGFGVGLVTLAAGFGLGIQWSEYHAPHPSAIDASVPAPAYVVVNTETGPPRPQTLAPAPGPLYY